MVDVCIYSWLVEKNDSFCQDTIHIFMVYTIWIFRSLFSEGMFNVKPRPREQSFTMADPFEIRRRVNPTRSRQLRLFMGRKVDCGPFFAWWYNDDYMVTFMANRARRRVIWVECPDDDLEGEPPLLSCRLSNHTMFVFYNIIRLWIWLAFMHLGVRCRGGGRSNVCLGGDGRVRCSSRFGSRMWSNNDGDDSAIEWSMNRQRISSCVASCACIFNETSLFLEVLSWFWAQTLVGEYCRIWTSLRVTMTGVMVQSCDL